jgi:hypothetical protein
MRSILKSIKVEPSHHTPYPANHSAGSDPAVDVSGSQIDRSFGQVAEGGGGIFEEGEQCGVLARHSSGPGWEGWPG